MVVFSVPDESWRDTIGERPPRGDDFGEYVSTLRNWSTCIILLPKFIIFHNFCCCCWLRSSIIRFLRTQLFAYARVRLLRSHVSCEWPHRCRLNYYVYVSVGWLHRVFRMENESYTIFHRRLSALLHFNGPFGSSSWPNRIWGDIKLNAALNPSMSVWSQNRRVLRFVFGILVEIIRFDLIRFVEMNFLLWTKINTRSNCLHDWSMKGRIRSPSPQILFAINMNW